MPAGIGASGIVGVAFETTKGTYVAPTVYVPILSETLKYTEAKYYSQQLRQQTADSDVQSGFYHVEGDIELEVDSSHLPYFLYASRHTITKSGAGPFTYKAIPNTAGATSTGAGTVVAKTLSITIVRNGVCFAYTGCTVSVFDYRIEDGVLKCTMSIVGEAEATQAVPTATWVAPLLYGAGNHYVYVDTSGTAPTFATASTDFNGFNFKVDQNAEAQNRIVAARSATYVKYGKTDGEITSELDFVSKAEYDLFKAATVKAFKLESLRGGATFAAATDGVKLQMNRVAYDAYDIELPGMGDIIMAGFTGHMLNIVGGDSYEMTCKSLVVIT